MSYERIKADIDDKVYENGEQQITGANLNSVLQGIVDTLGEGFQFGGVVFPDSSYEEGDEKIAFVATEVGTYPNFGELEVLPGEIAVFLWDGEWAKQVVEISSAIDNYDGDAGSIELKPHSLAVVESLTADLSVTLGEEVGAGVNEYQLRFTMGSTLRNVSFPASVKFPKDFDASTYWESNCVYEVSIIGGYAAIEKWSL